MAAALLDQAAKRALELGPALLRLQAEDKGSSKPLKAACDTWRDWTHGHDIHSYLQRLHNAAGSPQSVRLSVTASQHDVVDLTAEDNVPVWTEHHAQHPAWAAAEGDLVLAPTYIAKVRHWVLAGFVMHGDGRRCTAFLIDPKKQQCSLLGEALQRAAAWQLEVVGPWHCSWDQALPLLLAGQQLQPPGLAHVLKMQVNNSDCGVWVCLLAHLGIWARWHAAGSEQKLGQCAKQAVDAMNSLCGSGSLWVVRAAMQHVLGKAACLREPVCTYCARRVKAVAPQLGV